MHSVNFPSYIETKEWLLSFRMMKNKNQILQ